MHSTVTSEPINKGISTDLTHVNVNIDNVHLLGGISRDDMSVLKLTDSEDEVYSASFNLFGFPALNAAFKTCGILNTDQYLS